MRLSFAVSLPVLDLLSQDLLLITCLYCNAVLGKALQDITERVWIPAL